MEWVKRKIYLYNVTFGLYMLDWWERCLFNTLIVVLMWFIFYNTSRHVTEFCKSIDLPASLMKKSSLISSNMCGEAPCIQ